MAELIWDKTEDRVIETGVDHGVVYPKNSQGQYGVGEAWNGLTGITESPSGAEATAVYADNIKYMNMYSAEDYKYTIEAVTYPDGFAACDGVRQVSPGLFIPMQTRKAFGLAYRTQIANEDEGIDHGYKLHLVYNSKVTPSEKSHSTVNESPENETFSWEASTTPEVITVLDPDTGKPYKPTAHLEIDSRKVPASRLAELEAILFGTSNSDPTLPLPDDVINLFTRG